MELRDADRDDIEAVRRVVRRSFEASYALDPQEIQALLEEPFGTERLESRLLDAETTVLLAERDGEVVGVAEGTTGDAEIGWLHVHPEHRGKGIGTGLLERLHEDLSAGRTDGVRARILDANVEGGTFFEHQGFERVDRTERDLVGETLIEHVYADVDAETTEGEADDRPPETVVVDGTELDVDSDRTSGTDAPFFDVLLDGGDERFGFYCANCGTVVETMDELGRIECGTCGNARRPDQWDDAYL